MRKKNYYKLLYGNLKPVECVGTFKEIRFALTKTIQKIDKKDLPFLLKYYDDNFEKLDIDILSFYNENNNIPKEFEKILKGKILK